MPHSNDTLTTSRSTGSDDLRTRVEVHNDDSLPEHFINVRLSNGAAFYTAGGTTISGGATLTSDQGAPALLSSAWPVKVTDGSSVLGTPTTPINVVLASGGLAAATPSAPLWVTGSVYVLNQAAGGASNVTTVSGSVTGLLVGGVPLASTNPIWVTGSVGVTNTPSSITVLSGSVSGLLVGGVAVSQANPLPVSQQGIITVTGSVHMTDVSSVTGTISLARAVDIATMPNVTVSNPQTTVTVLSGSITGLLLGGVAVAGSNPIPVTGTIHLADVSAVTGTLALARAVDIATMPNVTVSNPQTTITVISGSVTGLLLGGVPIAGSNPIPVTGTIHLADVSSITGTIALSRAVDIASIPNITIDNPQTIVTVLSGSVSGLLIGGVPLANSNPVPITGTIHLADVSTVTGSVTLASVPNVTVLSGSISAMMIGGVLVSNANPIPVTGNISLSRAIDVATLPSVAQGTGAPLSAPWSVQLVSGSDIVGQTTNPLWVTGSVYVINQTAGGAASNVTAVSGSVTGLLLGGVAVAGSNPVPITGTIHLADVSTITGSVILASSPNVTTLSGSISALMVGGAMVSSTNPVWVTGSVHLADVSTITGSVTLASVGTITGSVSLTSGITAQSGSIVGLLVGGVPLANSNPVPITGTISLASVSTITGSITLASAPNVIVSSGSVSGLLYGGVAASSNNPFWVTGSVHMTDVSTITGSVILAAVPNVTVLSGSVTGLLYGGVAASSANPFWVTGSIHLTDVSTITGSISLASSPNVTVLSGSVSGLLLGGVPVAGSNPIPVTGTIHLADVSTITGSVSLASGITMQSGSITGLLYGGVAASSNNPFWVTGSVFSLNSAIPSGSITGLLVGGVAVAGSNPVPVTGSVSLTSGITAQSGSITGLLYGGVAASSNNPFWITGSVHMTDVSTITGSITLAAVPNVIALSGSVSGLLVGGVAVANSNPVPVTGTITISSLAAVKQLVAGTVNVVSLTSSVTSQLLIASNINRLGLTIFNDSPATAYLKYSAPVATNDFSFKMVGGSYYETPYAYTGRIDIVWVSVTGSSRITEFTI